MAQDEGRIRSPTVAGKIPREHRKILHVDSLPSWGGHCSLPDAVPLRGLEGQTRCTKVERQVVP
jgi:hypothetical protein